ncbi:MAG: hypothetical protein AAFV95_06780 [Bacteroidota bacterium]
MAIISNFELLAKPIAPTGGPASEIARVAVQGYFLEISNLESRDIKLIFRTRTSKATIPPDSPNTEFTATNNSVVYDITQDNLITTSMASAGELIATKQLGHYVICLPLPAGQTATLAILPNIPSVLPTPADLAIRGYTELVLSSDIPSFNPLRFASPPSARILVSAEHRGTFIDPQFDLTDPAVQTNLDFDQLAYSINTANGQAEQLLNTHARFNAPFQDFLTSDFIASDPLGESVSLSQLSQAMPSTALAPQRSVAFTVGTTPVRINYSVQKGNFVVEEKSIEAALNLLKRKKKLSSRSVTTAKALTRTINSALRGSTRADTQLKKILEKLI